MQMSSCHCKGKYDGQPDRNHNEMQLQSIASALKGVCTNFRFPKVNNVNIMKVLSEKDIKKF